MRFSSGKDGNADQLNFSMSEQIFESNQSSYDRDFTVWSNAIFLIYENKLELKKQTNRVSVNI